MPFCSVLLFECRVVELLLSTVLFCVNIKCRFVELLLSTVLFCVITECRFVVLLLGAVLLFECESIDHLLFLLIKSLVNFVSFFMCVCVQTREMTRQRKLLCCTLRLFCWNTRLLSSCFVGIKLFCWYHQAVLLVSSCFVGINLFCWYQAVLFFFH